MKKLILLIIVMLAFAGCGSKSVKISDDELVKIENQKKMEIINKFYNSLYSPDEVEILCVNFDRDKYDMLTSSAALTAGGVTITNSKELFSIADNGNNSFTANTYNCDRNYISDGTICTSEIVDKNLKYSDVMTKVISQSERIMKIKGEVVVETWDYSNGNYQPGDIKTLSFDYNFSKYDALSTTEIGKNESVHTEFAIINNDKITKIYDVGFIKSISIGYRKLYTAVYNSNTKLSQEKIILVKGNDGTYKIDFEKSFE